MVKTAPNTDMPMVEAREEMEMVQGRSQWYEVLADFSAQDENELSVRAGEAVVVSRRGGEDGWILVSRPVLSMVDESGYVPTSYIHAVVTTKETVALFAGSLREGGAGGMRFGPRAHHPARRSPASAAVPGPPPGPPPPDARDGRVPPPPPPPPLAVDLGRLTVWLPEWQRCAGVLDLKRPRGAGTFRGGRPPERLLFAVTCGGSFLGRGASIERDFELSWFPASRARRSDAVAARVAIAAAPGGDPRTLELRAPTREARDAWCETLRYVIGIASAR
ncbi:hypothetical protein SO694_00156025 [Aureococcus anophagefferens]|uniref:SH3 domain-containing protein n=1 Tax=Aureococcus anophagefferens TaxID=44056 RepID=A0ABR1G0P7_AURAN